MDHYRSISSVSFNIPTPASQVTCTTFALNLHAPVGVGVGQQFWTVGGGAVATDIGVPVPLFRGDITLRGGVSENIFYNKSTTSDVRIKLWLLTTVTLPNFSFFPAAPSLAWDPTSSADFITNVGRPFMTREIMLEQGNSYTFKTRFKLRKIDQESYSTGGRSLFMFMIIHNVGSSVATSVDLVSSQNLSFSGDAIGTT